ncbi:hypothetical protein [Persicitalea jodogahamensis]|uniref:hypothetical protein n=1 Tax=Persicitalea jodogahamensis TaxID=402147 RepID=UPI0016759C02|nr:hypothetical protein [Persicitalea jodogahamensis]
MEMLIFFFISLIAGVLAAYLVEQNRQKQSDVYHFQKKPNNQSNTERLLRISRHLKSA